MVAEQIVDCGAKLALVSTAKLFGELQGCDFDKVRLVAYDGNRLSLADFVAGVDERAAAAATQSAVDQTQPDDLATILYTSGTTGQPRGVMLSQHNLACNATSVATSLGCDSAEGLLNLLPLSHIFARTCDLYCWLVVGARLAVAECRETIFRDCKLAQPQHINGVPYFYQKIHDRIRGTAGDEGAAIRELLGGKIARCCSGGAALAPDVEQWFADSGMPIFAGYGLTESSPVVAASTAAAWRLGSVGRPLPDVEVRIAADGEILVRGPCVMQGYWNDVQATADTVRDGWLQTGDLGTLDDEAFLSIRGRKKEIIVLSTGKNVAPTRVEGLLAASPLVEQVAVVGDGRSHLGAIIVPCAEALKAEIRRRRIVVLTSRQALRHRKVHAIYAEEIARRLSEAAREEQVHAYTLLGRGFSIEEGELTPKLSLRRDVILRNLADEIEAMYAKAELPEQSDAPIPSCPSS
jgi:long-chain acyl-CoA synthetase